MPLSINTNLDSLGAQRNAALTGNALATSMQRLASGLRVNTAADDAAGLSIGARFDAQVRGMNVGVRNANDGISMLQTADDALAGVSEMLQRMRELAVQAANATNNSVDSTSLDAEFQALGREANRTLGQIKFNGIALYNVKTTLALQVGANVTDTLSITFNSSKYALGVSQVSSYGLMSPSAAAASMNSLDAVLDGTTIERAVLGAATNRLGAAIAFLQNGSANQAGARSRIMDADFATETANLSRAGILQQAGNAMVAQANRRPREVLALLRQ